MTHYTHHRARPPSPAPSTPTSILVPSIRLTSATPSTSIDASHRPAPTRKKSVRILDARVPTREAPWPEPVPAPPSTTSKGNKEKDKKKKKMITTSSGFRVFVDPNPPLPIPPPSRRMVTISNPRPAAPAASSSRTRTHSSGTLLSMASTHTASSAKSAPVPAKAVPVHAPAVQVKKSRSRLGLDALRAAWGGGGALADVTNLEKEEKEKEGEREKGGWWSIGRRGGEKRKESRERERATSPTPTLPPSRAGSPIPAPTQRQPTISILLDPSPSPPPTTTYLAPPTAHAAHSTLAVPSSKENRDGSIAVRAMRSVRSIARIGFRENHTHAAHAGSNGKAKEKEEKEKAKGKEKEKKAAAGGSARGRGVSVSSGSSWEVGQPSEAGSPARPPRVSTLSTGSPLKHQAHLNASPKVDIAPVREEAASTLRPAPSYWGLNLRRARSSVGTVDSANSNRAPSPAPAAKSPAKSSGRSRPGLKGLFDRKDREREKRESGDSGGFGDTEEEWEKVEKEEEVEVEKREVVVAARREGIETPRKRPVSEGGLLELPRVASDISHITAANTDLSDLISRLDLSTSTPDCSPVKSAAPTPRAVPRPFTPASLASPKPDTTAFAFNSLATPKPDISTFPASALPTPATSTFGRLAALPSLASIRARHTPPQPERQAWLDCMPGAFGIAAEVSVGAMTPSPTPVRVRRLASEKALKEKAAAGLALPMAQLTPEATPLRPSMTSTTRPLTDRLSTCSSLGSSTTSSRFCPASPLLYRPKRSSMLSTEIRAESSGSGSGSDAYASAQEEMESEREGDLPEELQAIVDHSWAAATLRGMGIGGPMSPPPMMPLPAPPPAQKGLSNSTSMRGLSQSCSSAAETGASTPTTEAGSFDFTGELNTLNEAGSRMSFVRELESAFRTPAEGFRAALEWGVREMEVVQEEEGGETSFKEEELVKAEVEEVHPAEEAATAPVLEVVHHAPSDSFATLNSMYDDKLVGDTRLLDTSMPAHLFDASIPSLLDIKHLDLSALVPPTEETRLLDVSLPSMLRESASLASDGSSKRALRRDAPVSVKRGHNRSESAVTMSSLGEVRNSGTSDPFGYSAGEEEQKASNSDHARNESQFSMPSISSFGNVINSGVPNPFGYAQSARTRMDSTTSGIQPLNAATMAALDEARRNARFKMSTDSDVSKWSYQAPAQMQLHKRDESSTSGASSGPPVSIHNRAHTAALLNRSRGDSADSMSSVAQAYAALGPSGGRMAWVKHGHGQEESMDSIISGLSAVSRLARPGVSDKMFESALAGAPLFSILASPDVSDGGETQRSSFDSIMDDRRSSIDSLFDNPGRPSSVSSDSIFGAEDGQRAVIPALFLQQKKAARPISMISTADSDIREDDTVMTMIGGEKALGRSVTSAFANSPCVFAEKRKHAAAPKAVSLAPAFEKIKEAPREELSPASSMDSFRFGGKRMANAQEGLLERESLEDVALRGVGQNESVAQPTPQFFRPAPASSRKKKAVGAEPNPVRLLLNTIPPDTPPYTSSEAGSQSSIDMSKLKIQLEAATPTGVATARARARGQGHKRQVSRGSAIGTIEEETPGLSSSPPAGKTSSGPPSPLEPSEEDEPQDWDKIAEKRKQWVEWQQEASAAVRESAEQFQDTEFSKFAMQTFHPPHQPSAILAYVEHSRKMFVPLPYVRRRTRSRPSKFSPYPLPDWHNDAPPRRPSQDLGLSPEVLATLKAGLNLPESPVAVKRTPEPVSPAPALAPIVVTSPLPTFSFAPPPAVTAKPTVFTDVVKTAPRPRVKSDARRAALGWSRRTNTANAPAKPSAPLPLISNTFGKADSAKLTGTADRKENEAIGLLVSPNESLRLSRPKPKGRPKSSSRPVAPLRL